MDEWMEISNLLIEEEKEVQQADLRKCLRLIIFTIELCECES